MKTFLGIISDSFTIQNTDRVIIVDADCSSTVKRGDFIEIVYSDNGSVSAQVLDGILEEGAKFNCKSEKVSAIRISNASFEANNVSNVSGAKVYRA